MDHNEDEGIGMALLYKNIHHSNLFLKRVGADVSVREWHRETKTNGGLKGLGHWYTDPYLLSCRTLLDGAVKYADCTSAEGLEHPNGAICWP